MDRLFKDNLIKVRKVESVINKNLFFICVTVTVIVMTIFTVEFFSRGAFSPSRMGFFYIGVLFIYTVHKEMLRWLEEKRVERQGEAFLYSWIGLTTLFYVINFFTKDYYCVSPNGNSLTCMLEVTIVTLQVAVIFILARLSKILKIIMAREKKS